MKRIEIIKSRIYLPRYKVKSNELENKLELEKEYIYKRTGIQERYYAKEETIEELAQKSVENLISKLDKEEKENILNQIELIIVATTSPSSLMPGISNEIQKKLEIKKCICLDILAGCSGYINAIDIAQLYLSTNRINKALIIGVDKLSAYTDKKDIGTSIILSDGAGALLLGVTTKNKKYISNINAEIDENKILTCKINEKIQMKGKEIYKYAVTNTIENIKELLKKSEEKIENVKYIIPHQSNSKIMKSIDTRLKIEKEKMFINIENIGNTFCASIPIALNEMFEKNLLYEGDKVILLGYGGGLNTGSILLEI